MNADTEKRMKTDPNHTLELPLKHSLTPMYVLSLIITCVVAAVSVISLLHRTTIYPTNELLRAFLPNDIAMLFIGVPMLLVSMWLTRRRKLLGLLFWPGALFFVFYTYFVYFFAMPHSRVFLVYLSLVTMSGYGLIGLVGAIDGIDIQQRLASRVPERFSGGVLAGFGLFFFARVVIAIIKATADGIPVPATELALHITDFVAAPAWVVGGILLWRRTAFGYVAGLGLLFQASMLFIGLIIVFIVQPFLTGAPFSVIDVVVVFIMGLICFIPMILFIRGVVQRGAE